MSYPPNIEPPDHVSCPSFGPAADGVGLDARVAAIVQVFQDLQPDDLAQFDRIYAPDVRFRDPFNDVSGLAAVRAIFAHMYTQLEAPRFVVLRTVAQGDDIFLTWDMCFRFRSWQRRRDQVIHGASHLHLDATGRIAVHRDYWDAAEELYAKLPVVGSLMRGLKSLGRT